MNRNNFVDRPNPIPGQGKHFSPDYSRPTSANLAHAERNIGKVGVKPTFDKAAAQMVETYGPLPAVMLIPMVALAGAGIFGDSMGAQVDGGNFGHGHDVIEHPPKADIELTSFRGVANEFGVGYMGKVLVPDQNSPRNTAIRTAVAKLLEGMGYDTTKANIVTLEVLSAANAKAQREGRAPQFTKGSGTLTIVGAPDSDDSDSLPDFFVVGQKNGNGDLEVSSGADVDNLQMAALIQGKDGFGIPTANAPDGNMEIVQVSGSENSSATVKLVKPDGKVVDAIGYTVPGVASIDGNIVDGGNIFSVATPVSELPQPESEIANFDLGVVLVDGEPAADGSRVIEKILPPAEYAGNEGAEAKWQAYFDAERLGFDEGATEWVLTQDGRAVLVDKADTSRIIAEYKMINVTGKPGVVWNWNNFIEADGENPLLDVCKNWVFTGEEEFLINSSGHLNFVKSLNAREFAMITSGADMMYGASEGDNLSSRDGFLFSRDGKRIVTYRQIRISDSEGFIATRDADGKAIILYFEGAIWS